MRRTWAVFIFLMAVVAVRAQTGEPWTESLTNWSLQAHQSTAGPPHAANLRLDPAFKRFGAVSLVCDVVPLPGKSVYSELRYTFPQPYDMRAMDALHLSYQVPAGMGLTRLDVQFAAPDWKSGAGLPEAIKPVTGEWQDLTIPLTQFKTRPGFDWGQVGSLLVLYFFDEGPKITGPIHLDGVWLERTGTGIGNHPAPPSIFFADYYEGDKDIDATYRKHLEEKGYSVVWGVLGKQTWDTLSKFNVVVLTFIPEADGNRPGEWLGLPGMRALLERYVAAGGGLLVSSTAGTPLAATGANLMLKPMGLELLNEQVTDPSGVTYTQELFPNMPFAYTEAVTPDPLTQGVPGLWYSTDVQFTGAGGGSFTSAVLPGPDWKVLVKGSPTAATHKPSGSFGLEPAAGTVTSAPVLCAVRPVGTGRVAVLPMNGTHTYLSGYHDWWQGLVLSTGAKGKPSGAEQLLLNLYGWLAEPSRQSGALGGYTGEKPEPIKGAQYVTTGDAGGVMDWATMAIPGPSPYQWLGLVGAHSAFSDGQGTVAEWVAAAKAAGYQWLAFTEPYDKMTPEKWEQLKTQCAAASGKDFCAIPGFQLVDPAGDHSLALGPMPFPDPKLKAERMDLSQAIGYAYGFPAQVQYRLHEGLAPWYRSQFHYAGVFTYRDGKLLEDAEKEYWELQAREFLCYPMAVHETFRPADVARERQVGYQNYYTFGPLDKMYDDFCRGNYKFFFYHDLVYISNGPKIERYTVQNSGTSYFDIPPGWSDAWRETVGADRWRVVARASSPVGLKELRLLDSGEVLRDYACAGVKEFSQNIDGHHDRQYAFGVEVTDTQGGRALASSVATSGGRHWFGNCGDNENIMTAGTFGTTVQAPHGYECYFPRWGVELWPELAVKHPEPLNLPHDERLRFASTDCVIVDNLFQLNHKQDVLQVGGGRMMRPLYPLRDWEARQRSLMFTPNPNTPQYTIYEPQVTFKRDVVVDNNRFPNLRLLYASHGAPMGKGDFAYATVANENGETLVQQTPATVTWPTSTWTGTLPVGGYVGAFPNFTGAGALFALEPDTQFAIEGGAQSRRIQVGKQIPPGTVLKAGTTLSTRVLFMEGKWRTLTQNTEFEETRRLFGLQGKPGYSVTPSLGTVAGTLYTCTLKADGGGFRGKFSQAPLPTDLPVIVQGLQPRWDSGVWIVGTQRVRFFGRFEGNGYTTLRLNDGPVEAFLGHPIVCDAPDLWLTLVEADAKHLLVIAHNPTDQAIKAHIRKAKGFYLGPALDTTVTVPAGQSVTVTP